MTLIINMLTVLNHGPTSFSELLCNANIAKFNESDIHKEFVLAQLEERGLVGDLNGMYFCPNLEAALAHL